jgi:hypothetical protein
VGSKQMIKENDMTRPSETRKVQEVRGVDLAGFGELYIKQGLEESLVVEAEEEMLPLIKTENNEGILKIRVIPGLPWFSFTVPWGITYRLTVKNLDTIRLSGAGRIQGTLAVQELAVNLSGAGSIELAGSTVRQVVNLSGAGSYQARDLASHTAQVTVSGTGSVTVWVQESLDATVSGIGAVDYYGNPQLVSKVSGLGGIHHKGDK